MRRASVFLLLGCLALLLIGGRVAGARPADIPPETGRQHPADMFLQNLTVRLTPEGVQVTWRISPGALLAFLTWDEADTDRDSFVTEEEAIAWIAPVIPELVVAVDSTTALPWRLDAITWPGSVARFEMGDEAIEADLFAPWPEGFAGQRDFLLYSRYQEATSVNWFYVHGMDGVVFTRPHQQNGLLQMQVALPGTPADDETIALLDYWDSGTPALGASAAAAPALPDRTASSVLTDLVSREQTSPLFTLAALGIALLLGAIHALTPGHGKTLVAAYLVGSRGTPRHAAALGAVVTLTHTGSVLALGLVTLFFSRYFMPTQLFPVLEIASGLLVVIMGLVLLWRRYQGWQAVRRLRARQAAPPPPPSGKPSPSGSTRTIAINQPIQSRDYDAVLPRNAGEGISWRALIALGISGGLVPCPDAIAILLVAIAINRLALGLSLVVTFSLGLAVVLIAIGIAMVQSRRLMDRFTALDRFVPAMPLLSAVIVLALGLVLTYNAVNRTGFLGITPAEQPGSTTLIALGLEGTGRAFDLTAARVLYLAPLESGHDTLWAVPASGGEPQRFGAQPQAIWDFEVSPDGARVVYAAAREGSGSGLWLINADGTDERQLLDCDNAACRNAVWAPDGTQVIYERLDFSEALTSVADITSLWWLDIESGETGPVFQDRLLPGYSPRWAPNGVWLSYVTAGTTGLQVYNLQEGTSLSAPNVTGSPAIWHPAQDVLLMTDVQPAGNRFLTHLMRYDLTSGERVDLTGETENIEDVGAAWSPDGTQIAVVRREIRADDRSPGNGIVLMRPDGSIVRALATPPDTIHQDPVWSPDGRTLLYAAYNLLEEWPEPHLRLLDV
ncbi:MAG: PD40 domain-containing protein, partial [Anaerolineae bacterium]|nr:PD40 domain-containing protein [Anaerolineae bacterium]